MGEIDLLDVGVGGASAGRRPEPLAVQLAVIATGMDRDVCTLIPSTEQALPAPKEPRSSRLSGDDRARSTMSSWCRAASGCSWAARRCWIPLSVICPGLGAWFEHDERVFVDPRSPYVQVDALRSNRPARVEPEGLPSPTRALRRWSSRLDCLPAATWAGPTSTSGTLFAGGQRIERQEAASRGGAPMMSRGSPSPEGAW